MDTNLQLLKILLDNEVEFILVGGMAAAVHGSTIITWDMDVYAPLTDENNFADRQLSLSHGWTRDFACAPDRAALR